MRCRTQDGLGSACQLQPKPQDTGLISRPDQPGPGLSLVGARMGLGQLADTTNPPLRIPGMLETVQLIGTRQIPNTLTMGCSTDCTEMYVGHFSSLFS